MGQDPTEEEIFEMIAEVDADGSNEIGVQQLMCWDPTQYSHLSY